MSQDQIKAFLAKAQSDPSLVAKIKAAKDNAALAEAAKEAGFSLSASDFDSMSNEVSEDELEAVQGGTIISPILWTTIIK